MADPVTTADTVAGLINYKLFGFAEFILKYQLMHIVVAVIGGTFTASAARKALERGNESKYRTPCNGTEYIKLGEEFAAAIGREGEELSLQRIRKESDTVDLREVFDSNYSSQVVKYLDRASKFCTPERPFVMEFLRYVVPPSEYDAVLEQMSRDIFNHFGPNDGVKEGIAGYEYYEEKDVYYLLVFEPTAQKKQYRFITIDESMLEYDVMPDFNDLYVEESKNRVIPAKDHYHRDRYFTNQALIRGIQLDIDGLYSRFRIGEKTGRVLDVRENPLIDSNVVQFPTRDAA